MTPMPPSSNKPTIGPQEAAPPEKQGVPFADRSGLFIGDNGKNLAFTFALVSSLFLLWGLCNGMIDLMDKHFHRELSLTTSQSAWVQFAHYLGYFLLSLPAGWLATKLGTKAGSSPAS